MGLFARWGIDTDGIGHIEIERDLGGVHTHHDHRPALQQFDGAARSEPERKKFLNSRRAFPLQIRDPRFLSSLQPGEPDNHRGQFRIFPAAAIAAGDGVAVEAQAGMAQQRADGIGNVGRQQVLEDAGGILGRRDAISRKWFFPRKPLI